VTADLGTGGDAAEELIKTAITEQMARVRATLAARGTTLRWLRTVGAGLHWR
jgi:hypothetical protein